MKSTRLKGIKAIAMTVFSLLVIQSQLAAQENHENRHRHPAAQSRDTKHHHYKLVILGTLGGRQSYGDPGDGAANVNNRGVAAGVADTATPDPFYPNFNPNFSGVIGAYPLVYHAFTTRNGTLVDLGGLQGGLDSTASFITDNGLVSGQALNGSIDPITGWPASSGVLWKQGKIINLGTLGGYESQAGRVNSRGQVTGIATNTIPDEFSMYYPAGTPNATQLRAFVWDEKNGMQDIGTLGGSDAFAPLINERGQIAGFSYTGLAPSSGCPFPLATDAFIWERNVGMTDLGTFGGTCTLIGNVFALNNRGQVVGQSNLTGDQAFHPFLWDKGTLTDLGTLGGPCGFAAAINEKEAVAGLADIAGVPCAQQSHAFLWTSNSGITDLGTVGDDCFSAAFDINNKNQAVGLSISCDGNAAEAVLWENGDIINLNVFVPPGAGISLEDVEMINDRGELFGEGFLDNGDSRAFLLIPCDENHPGLEGCDYSLIEARALPQVPAPLGVSSPTSGHRFPSPQARPPFRTRVLGRPFVKSGGDGEGESGPPLSQCAACQPLTVVFQPASLNFGTVQYGQTKTLTTTLSNVGSTTVSISTIKITGTDTDVFSQTHNCGKKVPPGQSCFITVTFKPLGEFAKNFLADVSVTDDAKGSPQQVPLSGTGVPNCNFSCSECPARICTCISPLGACVPFDARATAQNLLGDPTLNLPVKQKAVPGCREASDEFRYRSSE